MKAKHWIAALFSFSFLVFLCADPGYTAQSPEGKAVFKSRCQGCHRIEGDGSYPSAFYRQYRPKDFSQSAAWENLDEGKIRFVLTRGQGVMKPIPLTAEETKALIDYMMHDLKK